MREITLRGKKYPIIFDLENARKLLETYDNNMDNLVRVLLQNDLNEVAVIYHSLIYEGVVFKNEELGTSDVPPSLDHVKRLINYSDALSANNAEAITGAFRDFSGKNVDAQQLSEMAPEIIAMVEKQSNSSSMTLNAQTSKTATV